MVCSRISECGQRPDSIRYAAAHRNPFPETLRFATIAVKNPERKCASAFLPENHTVGADAEVAMADGLL
jgi:hypothetical protein